MIVLGVASGDQHDPSSALLIDGRIAAAAEEERFNRIKHSTARNPILSAQWCLRQAGVDPRAVDVVAFPWSPDAYRRGRWPHLWRYRDTPSYWPFILKWPKRNIRRKQKLLDKLVDGLGIDRRRARVEYVEHHLAHASSAYHLSGWPSAAILSIDGYGEYTSVLFARGIDGRIEKLGEVAIPDSLGLFYSLVTEFCGFEANSGEFKVMGMSAYGDPSKADLSDVIKFDGGSFRIDKHYLWPLIDRRMHARLRPKSKSLADRFGTPRSGDALAEPYVHLAAAAQKILEDALAMLVDTHLADTLRQCGGRLCFAGGTALNVRANGKLISSGRVKELFVQPAAHDAGLSLGAATFVANASGQRLEPMTHAYYGPEFTDAQIAETLEQFRVPHRRIDDPVDTVSRLLADGHVVASMQGRMEWGPRALGNRSILANPQVKGISDEVNSRIKFRETWRPFCPSIAAERAPELLGHSHPSPFMTFSFPIVEQYRQTIGECLHVDGTGRPQTVTRESNPLYYDTLTAFEKQTGVPAILNTSLNRRGEPMVCTPQDALAMFYGCGLEHLVMGSFHITKK